MLSLLIVLRMLLNLMLAALWMLIIYICPLLFVSALCDLQFFCLGSVEVCLSRHHRFLAVSTFSFSFPSRRNPVLSTWKPLVIILFFVLPCSGSPRFFSVCAMRDRWVLLALVFFCFCFLFSSSVFFFRAVLVFLCLCAWRDPRLLMVPEDPYFLSLAVVLFFFFWYFFVWASGSPGLFYFFMGFLHLLLWA